MTGPDLPSRRSSRRGSSLRRLGPLWWGAAGAIVVVTLIVVGFALAHQSPLTPPVRQAQYGPESAVSVSGQVGATPVLTLNEPLDIEGDEIATTRVGAGRTIVADGPVVLRVHRFDGKNASPLGEPELRVARANSDELGPLVSGAVIGASEGSRLLILRPQGNGSEIDVVDVIPTVAQGGEVGDSSSPLSVTMTEEGPAVSHGTVAPSGVSVQTLLEGTGPQMGPQDVVLVQYLAMLWTDGTVLSSTWNDGLPQTIDLGDAMPGLCQALTDRRVGSRLAITIPPDEAEGSDTLVLVVDILGIV